MRARDIIGLVIALALAVGVAFLTRVFLSKEEKKPPQVVTKAESVHTTKVLVASRNLFPGTKIKPGDLIWQDFPQTALNPHYILEGQITAESFNNAIVRYPIHASNPVNREEIVKPGDRGFLAAIIEPGKRAISIDVTPAAVDSGLIFPGDYVDVVVSASITEKDKPIGKSRTLLSNVKVLALDTTLAPPEANPKTPPHVATLEVTSAQAEVLSAGAKEGTLSLSLHSMEQSPVLDAKAVPAPHTKKIDKIILMRGKDKSEVEFEGK
jgi:pilus assembly protein CpaB